MATTKPVSILVVGMDKTPALAELNAQGHLVDIDYMPLTLPVHEYDAIVGPKCWRYLPDVSDKWLPLLLKEARAAQPKRVKKVKKKEKGVPKMHYPACPAYNDVLVSCGCAQLARE